MIKKHAFLLIGCTDVNVTQAYFSHITNTTMMIENSTQIKIMYSEFLNNTSDKGAAIYVKSDNSQVDILHSNFTHNIATVAGGAIFMLCSVAIKSENG